MDKQQQNMNAKENVSSLTRAERIEWLARRLLPAEFESLLYLLHVPHEHLSSGSSAQAQRAIEVLRWAEANHRLHEMDRLLCLHRDLVPGYQSPRHGSLYWHKVVIGLTSGVFLLSLVVMVLVLARTPVADPSQVVPVDAAVSNGPTGASAPAAVVAFPDMMSVNKLVGGPVPKKLRGLKAPAPAEASKPIDGDWWRGKTQELNW